MKHSKHRIDPEIASLVTAFNRMIDQYQTIGAMERRTIQRRVLGPVQQAVRHALIELAMHRNLTRLGKVRGWEGVLSSYQSFQAEFNAIADGRTPA